MITSTLVFLVFVIYLSYHSFITRPGKQVLMKLKVDRTWKAKSEAEIIKVIGILADITVLHPHSGARSEHLPMCYESIKRNLRYWILWNIIFYPLCTPCRSELYLCIQCVFSVYLLFIHCVHWVYCNATINIVPSYYFVHCYEFKWYTSMNLCIIVFAINVCIEHHYMYQTCIEHHLEKLYQESYNSRKSFLLLHEKQLFQKTE